VTPRPGGKYDELPELHVGEPFFIFRAQDALAPYALTNYAALLRAAAAGTEAGAEGLMMTVRLREQAAQVEQHAAQMLAWQSENHVRLPT
jgi:hypothetical protein